MSTTWALIISLVLLAANGFFVAAEFALVASKRHRLEQAAEHGSRAAVAALAGSRELSLMLAGAQLGITLCSLGLGALAEPAIAHLLDPALAAVGLPAEVSYAVAFLVALALVVFLHMVVGEMAPKSWAISDPERSALLLALPFRAFARLARPALSVLNGLANLALRAVRVTGVDTVAQAHGPDELRMLLEQSREHGLLPAGEHRLLTRLLQLQNTPLHRVMAPREQIVTVPVDAPAHRVEQVSQETGRSRLAVVDDGGRIVGQVHVRDAVRATTAARPARAGDLMTSPFTAAVDLTVPAAVTAMRQHRAQVAFVTEAGQVVGLVALEDLLEEVIGEFDDETDHTRVANARVARK
ncbi:HlyC/CorC family transporter [Planosporangium flavigriseum]|uniref:Membrane protein n=1 Tax=Planosporangium flavigriseum TaxID=373681 RepID=A0A8J3LPM0_9ACTN|nr:hemolysin family protein [Planosporangium flavigriseum]NJC65664.1 HlyC/CorC family transporter [Planosporangium flavigriseum]GIG76527.1 membrane protein [Planosporangium flavigriseum]